MSEHPRSVVFVLPGFPRHPVGGYQVVYRYANDLSRLGAAVTIVHGSESQFYGGDLPKAPLSFGGRLRHGRDVLLRPTRPAWFDLSDDVVSKNSPLLRAKDVPASDAVVATSVWTAPFVASLFPNKGSRFYFIQHYEDWGGATGGFVDSTWRMPLSKIVISKWLQEKASNLGVTCSYLPNAIDVSSFPIGPPVDSRPLQVCAQVSDIKWKRVDVLVAALIEVRRQVPDVQAVTFGTCARPKELPHWVEFIQSPARAELAKRVYQRSRVYICSSDAEGWHLPPAEAMASGVAVVSTEIGGVTEYGTGRALFAPRGDGTRLGQLAADCLMDTALCDRLSRSGSGYFQTYTPLDAARRLLGLLS